MNKDYAYCVGPNYFGGSALCQREKGRSNTTDRCDKPRKGKELKMIVKGKTKRIKLNQ